MTAYHPDDPRWADEDHYRDEMIAAWIEGDDLARGVPDATIAAWVIESTQRPRRRTEASPAAPLPPIAPPDALALSYPQAAAMLAYSVDHFERHVVPDLRVVVAGRRKTVPRTEVVRWIEQNAARALKGDR
ncbi:hypothetical protein [Paraconexibacter algicola]|uniref:Uncharacterized protein n=1 Tax=Paraconexibacter algicola TaxID=2133960 RepID=A0A2T4UDD6_9ACTN|nr:hypothetical protein [Paraconexibacter algicola]PTL55514.1 hypothetical protein C7Y72_17855 [Paraconexibacter algicola]